MLLRMNVVILFGSGIARIVKLTRLRWLVPCTVRRGAPAVFGGLMSAEQVRIMNQKDVIGIPGALTAVSRNGTIGLDG